MESTMALTVIKNARMGIAGVLFVFGLFGNTTSMIVMQQKKYRKVSTCLYLLAISLVDNVQLIAQLIILGYTEIKNHQIDDIYCKLSTFTIGWNLEASTYLIVAMTIDRFLIMRLPYNKKWRAPKYVKIIIVFVIFAALLRNAHRLKFATTVYDENLGHLTCSLYRADYQGSREFLIIDGVIQTIFPACILVTLNSYIIRKIKNKVQIGDDILANNLNQNPNENLFKAKQRSITAMLICVSFAVVAFTLPAFLLVIIARRIDKERKDITIFLLYQLSVTIYFMSSCANFYICLIGGSRFRRDARLIFKRCFSCHCKHFTKTVHPSN